MSDPPAGMASAATARFARFRDGFAVPWNGWAFMRTRPGLWRYAAFPVILNLLVTGLLLLLLVAGGIWGWDRVHAWFPDAWGWMLLEIVCVIGALLLAVMLAFLCWLLLQAVLCGYFYAKLGEQVERQLGVGADELCEAPLPAQIADALRAVSKLVLVNLGLLALHVVPLVGSIAAVTGSLYFDALILGAEFFSFPLDLRGKRRADKREFVRRHRWETLGLGAAVMLLSLVPIAGALLLTTAVTGAVLLHRQLTAAEAA